MAGLTGFLSAKLSSLPDAFWICGLYALLTGILYLWLAPKTFAWWDKTNPYDLLLTALILTTFTMTGIQLTYTPLAAYQTGSNWLMMPILLFLVPAILVRSNALYQYIPSKKFKTWAFPIHAETPRLMPIDPIRLVMNFTPIPSGINGPFEGYEVEMPTNEPLGVLFHYFLSFHNKHREYKKKPIQYMNGDQPVEWVLFKFTHNKTKHFLDMEKTLGDNQVFPNDHIYAAAIA